MDEQKISNGEKEIIFTQEYAQHLLLKIFSRICHEVSGDMKIYDRNGETKINFDNSFEILSGIISNPKEIQKNIEEKIYKYSISPFFNDPARLQKALQINKYPFLKYKNVAIGGEVLFTTNESFAPASSLCKNFFPRFTPKTFGAAGQVYDGWETRRHNMFPPDYAIIKLPSPSRIFGVNIDTAHFNGNPAEGSALLGLLVTQRHHRYQKQWVNLLDPVILKGFFLLLILIFHFYFILWQFS